MLNKLIQRTASITLAAVLTLGMLSGIDKLSQADAAAPQWAQKANAPSA